MASTAFAMTEAKSKAPRARNHKKGEKPCYCNLSETAGRPDLPHPVDRMLQLGKDGGGAEKEDDDARGGGKPA